MGAVLAIDFGERRVGLALAHPPTTLAMPWATWPRTSDRALVAQLAELVEREAITRVVLGEPRGLDGQDTPFATRVRSFAAKLERSLGMPVELVAETLTSHAAAERLREAGVDLRRHPEKLDAVAAQILLEEALAPITPRPAGKV